MSEILKVEAFTETIQSAPAIIQQNETSVNNAISAATKLIQRAQSEGMSDILDVDLNNYMVKARATLKLCNERRVPVTKLFDDVKKLFTDHEKKLDSKNSESVIYKIQKLRNDYAAEKAKKAEQERQKLAREKAISEEKIIVITDYKAAIKKQFYALMDIVLQDINSSFEGSTLETIDTFKAQLLATKETFDIEDFKLIKEKVNIRKQYLTDVEFQELIIPVNVELNKELVAEYSNMIKEIKTSIQEKIPSKIAELKRIAEAEANNKAEAEKLKAESEKRKQEEVERLRKEAEEKAVQAQQSAMSEKTVMQANLNFETEAAAVVIDKPVTQVREGYEIIVKHQLGYQLIAAKYFERFALTESVAALEKKTLGSMKKECEKLAKGTGEMITSEYLEYKEIFKAVNKKL